MAIARCSAVVVRPSCGLGLVTNTTRKTIVQEIDGVRVIKAARLANVSSAPISLSLFAWMRRLEADIEASRYEGRGALAALRLARPSDLVKSISRYGLGIGVQAVPSHE